MRRREVLKIVTLGALAAASSESLLSPGWSSHVAWSPGDYRLRFFTEEENGFLDQLMEMIIPADHHSPGAHAAQVSLFADLMVSTGSEDEKKRWRTGLQCMREEPGGGSIASALSKAAANEGSPRTNLERFFVALKEMTVNGYYTSEIGIHQDLNYMGNMYAAEFPGCSHEGHKL